MREERRGDRRRRVDGAAQATLRPGCDVAVIDVSSGGALVQARRPMRPGARVHVRLDAGGSTLSLVAHVLRCGVWSINGEEGVVYRGALQFEHPCSAVAEEVS